MLGPVIGCVIVCHCRVRGYQRRAGRSFDRGSDVTSETSGGGDGTVVNIVRLLGPCNTDTYPSLNSTQYSDEVKQGRRQMIDPN